jgi:hypothetical protein
MVLNVHDCMCIGVTERPERKNVKDLFVTAGPLVLQNSKLDHVNAKCCLF